jgi:SAM-dependent methyltransferase
MNALNSTFSQVKTHKYIGEIIQEHSTNLVPIDSITYKNLSFKNKIKIADIGCGYGRCINYLMNIVPEGSEYIGIDPLENNKNPFIKTTMDVGFNGHFICGTADRISEYPENYFDLVLCNYSLYFFVNNLPQIVSKLKSSGLFITTTHSIKSLTELMIDLQKVLKLDHVPTWRELGSEQVLDNFNAENGYKLLQPHFSNVEKIYYKNELEFVDENVDKLFDLLNLKKATLIRLNDFAEYIKTKKFDDLLRKQICNKMKKTGKYSLNKDDLIFRCCNPKRLN